MLQNAVKPRGAEDSCNYFLLFNHNSAFHIVIWHIAVMKIISVTHTYTYTNMPDAHCHREPSTEVSNNECQTMHMPFPVQDRALSSL